MYSQSNAENPISMKWNEAWSKSVTIIHVNDSTIEMLQYYVIMKINKKIYFDIDDNSAYKRKTADIHNNEVTA